MFKRIHSLVAAAGIAALMFASGGAAQAQKSFSLVRDAEIEGIIRTYSTPIFEAAGLAPGDVSIYLVNDPSLNAFVAGGLNLFLHTGLIQRTAEPGQLIGVIAHETGHIAAGHLIRLRDEMESLTIQSVLATVLGAAAAVASGDGGVGAAIAAGGSSMAMRNFMQYSRAQESEADQAALRYLDRARWSSRGMVDFLGILEDQELLSATMQDPYLRTHPITRERVATAREHLAHSPHADAKFPDIFYTYHSRMIGKLDGFLQAPRTTLNKYREDDRSVQARYARTIAYFRSADLRRALPAIDALIAESPNDPYFHELRGQMLFENGRGLEALPSYERAVELQPRAAPLRQELARVIIDTGKTDRLPEAERHLNEVVRIEPRNATAWRLLGIAYGRNDNIPHASLALAEAALLRGARDEARFQAERARRTLPEGSPQWLRADDLKREAERRRDR
ncbi:MAG: M48 family metalloprotease [Alphaproteobacteria bacterium]